jgi:hypothetical protein
MTEHNPQKEKIYERISGRKFKKTNIVAAKEL